MGALWLGALDRPSLWTDEVLTLRYTESFATIDDDVHPPPYYAVVRSLFLLAPDSLVSARALSTASGSDTIQHDTRRPSEQPGSWGGRR